MPEQELQEDKELNFVDLFIPLTNKKVISFIFIIGLVVFFNSLLNPFQGDDSSQIVNNPFVRHLSSIPTFFNHSMGFSGVTTDKFLHAFYKPFLFTTYTLVYQVMGGSPMPFHILQLLIHVTSTVLIFLLFTKFMKRNITFIFSLIFLIHPLNSEAVIYIADMQDVLFVFFGLCAFLVVTEKKDTLITFKRLALIALLLFLSSLSKETGILFACMLPIYAFLFDRKNFRVITVTVVLTLIIYALLRFLASFSSLMDISSYSLQQIPLQVRLITIPKMIFYYLTKFVMPIHLAIGQEWFVRQIAFSDFSLPLIFDLLVLISIIRETNFINPISSLPYGFV